MHKRCPRHFRVLIVTPNQNFQREASKAFGEEGLDSELIADASRTREIATAARPDLVLLDADVPGVDARDLLTALKRDPRTESILVFLMSGVERHWGRSFALELGADEYLDKPLSLRAVAWRIRARLEARTAAISRSANRDSSRSDASETDRRQADALQAEELRRQRIPKTHDARPTNGPVLIVEDDGDVREALVHALEDEGIPTLAARNGQEALDLLHTDGVNPALILLDLMMPIMNGWEFRRRMETDVSIPHAPIVIISAQTRDDTMGSVAWLQKPMSVDDLLRTIQQVARASESPRTCDATDVVLRNHARA